MKLIRHGGVSRSMFTTLLIFMWATAGASGADDGLSLRRAAMERAAEEFDSMEFDSALSVSGQIQTRYTFNARTGQGSSGSVTNGFEGRRTKLKFSGRTENPNIRYTFSMAFSRRTGMMATEDVYARFLLSDEWSLKVGQFRPSVLREQIISSRYQLAAERSLLTSAFGQSYNTGVALQMRGEKLRLTLSAMDTTSGLTGPSGWEYIARGELMLSGERSSVSDFTSFREDAPALMVGAGVGYNELDPRTVGTAGTGVLNWSADLTAEFGGSSLFAAVVGSQTEMAGTANSTRLGVLVQGGVFVADDVELFSRFTHGDDDVGGSLNVLEAGVNWYVLGHDVKVSGDIGYSFDPVSTAWRASGAGWRGDVAGEDGQTVLRMQLQVLF